MKFRYTLLFLFATPVIPSCNKNLLEYRRPAPILPTFTMQSLTNDSARTWIPYRVHISENVSVYYIYQGGDYIEWYSNKYNTPPIYQKGDTVRYWEQTKYFVDTTTLENYRLSYRNDGYYSTTDTIRKHLRIPKTGMFKILYSGKIISFPENREMYKEWLLTQALGGLVLECDYIDSTNIKHTTLLYYR